MNSLRTRWSAFGSIVIDPWTVLTLALTAILIYLLANQTKPLLLALLSVLLTVSSGILGGIIGKKWDELTGEAIIVARGKAAIRGLKLLFASTVALERRVRLYLARHNRDKKDRAKSDLTPTYLEEVIERCGLLEEEVLSSIENWTDIIPEADVRTQIGFITELKRRVETLSQQTRALTAELVESRGRSEKDIDALKHEKALKEQELGKARRELAERAFSIGAPFSTGAYQPVGGSVLTFPPNTIATSLDLSSFGAPVTINPPLGSSMIPPKK